MLNCKTKVNFVEFRKQDQIEMLEKIEIGRNKYWSLKYVRFYIIWEYNIENK